MECSTYIWMEWTTRVGIKVEKVEWSKEYGLE